jgi:hypothetical protein
VQALGELDRGEPVVGGADHCEARLVIDQRAEGLEERLVVVREQDADPTVARSGPLHRER